MPSRIIREGILSSERIATLNWAEEVFYRRLMSVVDDHGLFSANHKLLRAACYPLHLDKVSDSDIEKWLTACVRAALVRVYPAEDGKRYLQMSDTRWEARSKPKYPLPPSENACEQLQTVVPVFVDVVVDEFVGGGVVENKSPSVSADVAIVFDHWRSVMNHPRAVLDQKRKKKIADALKKYPTDFLKKAIDGCRLSPYHMGQNDNGTVYDDIELILRDTAKIERFAGFVDRPPSASKIDALDERNRQHGEQWLNRSKQ